MASEVEVVNTPGTFRSQLANVILGNVPATDNPTPAGKVLEIAELNPRRGFSYSPRLFRAYAQALEASGRAQDARKWSNLAARADRALGLAVEPEPEILDLSDEDDDATPPRSEEHTSELQSRVDLVCG